MSRTLTKYVNFETLLGRDDSAITIVKLMMACNDLQLANEALSEWKKEQPNNRKARQIGAGMYFIRIQIAHLYEGFKVIEAIRNSPILLALINRCDARTQESFQNLEHYLPGSSKRAEFETLAGRIRHNITFHYDETGKLIEHALSNRAERSETQISSLTRGNSMHLWHFKVADDILNSIVVRQIWRIDRNVDIQVESDKVVEKIHQIFLWFIDFSGEFIWKYFEN